MPTTRNRWQQEIQPSPEPAITIDQAHQANTERQTSPPRPSVSPAPELATDFQDDPNPRSPKRRRISFDGANESVPEQSPAIVPTPSQPVTVDAQRPSISTTTMSPGLGASTASPSATAKPPQSSQTQQPSQPSPSSSVRRDVTASPNNTTAARPPPTSGGGPTQGTVQQGSTVPTPVPGPAATASQHLPPQAALSATSATQASPSTGPSASPAPAPSGPQGVHSVPRTAPPPSGALPPTVAAPAPAPRGPPPPPAEIIKRRIDNLQTLGDLADQILVLLSKMPVLDALALDADLRLLSSGQQPSSPAPAEYQRLRALFDPVRNIYVTGFPFLIADHLAMRDASQASIIRKANQAMFCSAIYAGGIGQLALDQAFLDIFVPENGQLLQVRSNIWLELKTQGFMTAMRLKAAPPNQVMSDLFPAGIESRIVARHPTSKTLTASELDFAARYEARRKILFEHISRNALPELDQKFTYVELANQVANFLIMTYGVGSKPVSQTTGIPANGQRQGQMGNNSTQAAAAPAVTMPELPTSMDSLPSFDSSDFVELAARAAAIAMRGTASPMSVAAVPGTQSSPAIQSGPHVPGQTQVNPMPGANGQHGSSNKPYVPLEPSDTIPHASQSAPTHVLYQRARAAEPIKSTTPGTPRADGDASQQRRPWSEEEERALMDGLDRVQGPHWANIMALHGPGGSLSETLKERNQVQLKDKARNLKLFFLKNKIEAPYYLSQVTGTLETRAPGQAEKLETETAGQAAKEPSADDAKVQIVDQAQDDAMEDVKIENEAKQQLRDGSLPNVESDVKRSVTVESEPGDG